MNSVEGPPVALMGLPVYLLSQTARMAKRDLDRALAGRGVRLPHMAVLAALADPPVRTGAGTAPAAARDASPNQLEIGRRLSIDPSDMTAVVDDLESLGYVERVVDPADRRRRALQRTEAGRQFFDELMNIAEAIQDELFAPLPPDRRAALRSDLQVLGALAVQRRAATRT